MMMSSLVDWRGVEAVVISEAVVPPHAILAIDIHVSGRLFGLAVTSFTSRTRGDRNQELAETRTRGSDEI
jgi:hypothetical protein